MPHMKRKLTLLLVCLLLLGGTAGASSEEVTTEAVASEEIAEEGVEAAEAPTEEETTADTAPSAKDYINYYLMPGDSPYLEISEAAEYIYTTADADNYEQIVFSAMDWNGLSETAQAEVNAALPEGYLVLLQEAVNYATVYSNGVVGSAAYVVSFEDGAETGGVSGGIAVAEIIEEAGLGEDICIPDAPALLADFGTDSTVRYSYGWWGGGRIYYGTKTGTLGPIYIGSPLGDAAATYITADLHTDYFYSSSMGAYYDCYCLSARSSYPKNKWVASSGEAKWNALSASQRTGLAKAVMYGQYYKDLDGTAGAFSGVQCAVWSIIHGQMDERGRGTATASGGDVVEYQIISTLPTITSEASYLTDYTFTDTLAEGLRYNGDVKIEFFTDAACTNKIATWTPGEKFTASYSAHGMTISMTASGLNEINASKAVYSSSVNSGYSDCTLRITYSATLNSDASVIYGDGGNPNSVTLRWQRSSTDYFDELEDDCHVFTYGIDLTKQFSDGQGDFGKVEFIAQNETDGYYLTATLTDGVYYITGHVEAEADATHFIPTDDGSLIIQGTEDDEYILTEVRTDNRCTLLKDDIHIEITTAEADICDCYTDSLGVTQNDARYTHIQKHLEHKLRTASATVDEHAVTMLPDGDSPNAFAPLTVINTRGFDLPQTGGRGNWIYPAIGITLMVVAGAMLLMPRRKKK